jgi:hypothetical protein
MYDVTRMSKVPLKARKSIRDYYDVMYKHKTVFDQARAIIVARYLEDPYRSCDCSSSPRSPRPGRDPGGAAGVRAPGPGARPPPGCSSIS